MRSPVPGLARRQLAIRIRAALGWRVLQLEHVGSTAVPGLAAKPVIDIDLTVADPGREPSYVPALEQAGFRLIIREPWWYGHRSQQVIREIYHQAFAAAGLLDD